MIHEHLRGLPRCTADDLAAARRAVARARALMARRVKVEVTSVEAAELPRVRLELLGAAWPEVDLRGARIVWSQLDLFRVASTGDVLHGDPSRRTLDVSMQRGEPRTGVATVVPFDYLEALATAYDAAATYPELGEALRGALAATEGARPPTVGRGGLPLDALAAQPWGTLWGPPGTGKTTTLARLLADQVVRTGERVLFVSTTHLATDTAATRFGAFERQARGVGGEGLRFGAGAELTHYEPDDLVGMLDGPVAVRRELSALRRGFDAPGAAPSPDDLEQARRLAEALSAQLRRVVASDARIVFATVYQATRWLTAVVSASAEGIPLLREGPPFDRIVIDEAGLISRATVAALSLLAKSHVMLAGDPRQLGPILPPERVRSPSMLRFVGTSALAELDVPPDDAEPDPRLVFLDTQHRSNARIGALVSTYAYDGRLRTSPLAEHRLLEGTSLPPTSLYRLDEDPEVRGHPERLRGERPRPGRGWVRPLGVSVLERLLAAEPGLRSVRGLVLAPFVAQVRAYGAALRGLGLETWSSTSIHRQQGGEADVVVFDTVHASSTGFSSTEWRRLVNVAISRARQAIVLVASDDELAQPFLRPLVSHLTPVALARGRVVEVARPAIALPRVRYAAQPAATPPLVAAEGVPTRSTARRSGGAAHTLGAQLRSRAQQSTVLSAEQERVRRMRIDDGPRLVRGVAGSGKTLVAAHWALAELGHLGPEARLVFAVGNRTLVELVRRTLEAVAVASGSPWPDPRLEVVHVADLLAQALPAGVAAAPGHDRIEALAAALAGLSTAPTLDVLYVDEAQDLGDGPLRALLAMVRPLSPKQPGDAPVLPVRIFYDDAQQLYARGRPHWSKLGLDLRGRSIVMRDAHRSTRAIGELALNVYARLSVDAGHAMRELVDDQLVERHEVDGRAVFRSLHHTMDGLPPWCRRFADPAAESAQVAAQLGVLVRDQGVAPGAVKVVTMNLPDARREALVAAISRHAPVEVLRPGSAPDDATPCVEVVTPHGIKGFDAEVVFVVGADRFQARERGVLESALYTAMTRARSLLYVSATPCDDAGRRIWDALESSAHDLTADDAATGL